MVRTYIESLKIFKFFQKLLGSHKRSAYRYTENILEKYNNLVEYKYIHNSSKRLNQIHTDTSITLIKDLQLGSSISQVRKQFTSSPYVKMYTSGGITRIVLLFKIKLDGQKIKVEAHFHKNKLFFSQFIFSQVSEKEGIQLATEFANKYNVADLDFANKNLVDTRNHCAKMSMGTDTTISYIDLNNLFFEKMQLKTAISTKQIELTYATNLGVQ